MLSGQQLVDTAYVVQTHRRRDTALRMITKYLPFLKCVHCHICLAITCHGDFCDGKSYDVTVFERMTSSTSSTGSLDIVS